MRDPITRIVRGNYCIYKYTEQIYKVVKFKCTEIPLDKADRAEEKHYETKLDNSISRTRKLILEKALCNPWEWFCTLTIDKNKYDRYNLKEFYKDFSQWLRDYRKKGYDLHYLLVPELHADNAWHLHGFFYGMPELESFSDVRKRGEKVPDYLVYSDFYNWQPYQDKFGFCSFGRIKSPVRSAFYISKYISKDHSRMVTDLGAKMFYCNQGLNRAVPHGEVYGHSEFLDGFLQQEYQYCSVGMTKVSDQQTWHFAFEENGFEFFDEMQPLFDDYECASTSFSDDMASINIELEQMSFMLDTEKEGRGSL